MKFCLGIVVAALALNCVLALPAHSPNDDAEVIDVPRRPQRPSIFGDDDTAGERDFHDFKGVIDTGSGYPFLQPVPHPFSFNLGFFDSFEDIFRRLRTRLWPLDLPAAGAESGEEGGSGFSFNLNPKNGNTTHTVKVVDGHKIEINDTTYGDSNSVFKVRVVNIRPLDSGESVPDTDSNTNNAASPVTSAPSAANDNKHNENDDSEDSDERREPLENDRKPLENEINSNIDDPEIAVAIEMLPTTSIDEADAANLNAEFVTDNTLESGSAEAETNNANDSNTMEHYEQQQDDEETALVAELSDEKMAEDVSLQHNEQLTVEDNNNNNNNGDENEPETADNINESNDDDEPEELTQVHREDDSSDEDVAGGGDDETAKLSAEFNEETDKDIDAVSAEFGAESVSITQEKQQNEDDSDTEDDDDERPDVRQSSIKHSNYAANNRQREDVTSSDDENSDSDENVRQRPMQMHPQFDAEWETLAEDLAAESNDLSNDIDIYDAVVPVDLSNDLAVNDIAASQPGFPINPDAEFIKVDGTTLTKPSLLGPKFEKLSLGVGAGAALNSTTTSYQQHAKQYSQNFK